MGRLSFNSKPNASTVPNLPEITVWGEIVGSFHTHNHFYFHSYSYLSHNILLYDGCISVRFLLGAAFGLSLGLRNETNGLKGLLYGINVIVFGTSSICIMFNVCYV